MDDDYKPGQAFDFESQEKKRLEKLYKRELEKQEKFLKEHEAKKKEKELKNAEKKAIKDK